MVIEADAFVADQYSLRSSPQLGTRYAQIQIINALRAGDRERASTMLLNLVNANGSLGPDDFSIVLDYCAKTPDPLVRSLVILLSVLFFEDFIFKLMWQLAIKIVMLFNFCIMV